MSIKRLLPTASSFLISHNQSFRLGRGGCTCPGAGCTGGGEGDALASCASPLGTPLTVVSGGCTLILPIYSVSVIYGDVLPKL
jgi:hypothetical protein